jgi:hypothetical protein
LIDILERSNIRSRDASPWKVPPPLVEGDEVAPQERVDKIREKLKNLARSVRDVHFELDLEV